MNHSRQMEAQNQSAEAGAGQQNLQEQDRDATQVSSLPLPPLQYVENYSDSAVAKGLAPPPPPPINDSFSMFGNPFSSDDIIVQSLESQGIRRLYSFKNLDRKKELHKLNHSVLVNFLDLLDVLIKCANVDTIRQEKIDDINLLFIHMHHLINEFRPHQTRETIRVMLQVQLRKRLHMVEKLNNNLNEVQEILENAIKDLPSSNKFDKSEPCYQKRCDLRTETNQYDQ